MKKLLYIIPLIALIGCYSNNCPQDNTVTCNYYFYDTEGTVYKYPYTLNISIILPGVHDVYVYRKLGEVTVKSNKRRTDLTNLGYSESIQSQRNSDTIYNNVTDLQYAEMPMSYFNKVDTLLFEYSNISQPDTIYVWHDSYPHVDLPECGSFRYHNLTQTRATQNAIDHLEIVNSEVNYNRESNIKVYFNVTTDNE